MTKKSDAPAIRFKGFSDAWEQRKVGDLLIERNQQAPMSDEYPLMAFIANEGVAPKGERYDRSALVTDTVNKLYKKTEKGDFIYSSNNLETGSIGLNKYGKACISPVYSIFEPTGIADSDFLGRRLVRKDFINAMVKWRQGVIYGQWRIHESDFLKIEIPVPSVEEQRKIGAYLDQLDNLITLHQRKCVFLFGFFQAFISMIFTASTFSWEQRKLGDVVQITMGQSPDGSTYSDGPSDYILVQGNADLQNGWVCPRIWTTQITKKADAGDLIMSVRAPAGAMGKTAYNAVIGRGVAAIKGNEFIYQLLVKMDMDGFWKTLSCGSTFESLNSDNIKNAEVKVPTTAEQVQIGDFFRHLDNLITLHQRECISFTARAGRLILTANKKRNTSSWEQRKVSDLAEKTYGGGTPTTSNEAYWNGDIPWIQSSDVVDGKLLGVEPRKWITQDGLNNSAAQLIPGNSIAIITRVGVGKLAFMPYSYATSQDFLSLSKLNAEPLFTVYACYKKLQSELNAVQGTSIKGITKDELLAKNIMVPRYAEQQQIGAFFKQLDNLITLHQRKPFLMKWRTSDANRNQTNRLVL